MPVSVSLVASGAVLFVGFLGFVGNSVGAKVLEEKLNDEKLKRLDESLQNQR